MDAFPPFLPVAGAGPSGDGPGASREEQLVAALAAANARVADLESQLANTTAQHRHCQNQLTALVNNLPMGLLLLGPDGQTQLMNAQFRELFGLPAEPVGTDTAAAPAIVRIDECFRDPAAFAARAWSLHEQGQTVLQEEFTLADGRIVALDYLVMDHEQAGRLICYRDVTERHRRAAQLRTVSFIPQQNPNPVLRLDAYGQIVHANPAAEPLAQALAATAPADWQQHRVALADAALHSARQHQEELLIAGQHFLCTAVAVPGEAFVTLYLTDITAWRRAEQRLIEQREFYETILEQVPIALAVVDAEFRYLFANPAVEPNPTVRAWMLGKTNEEACEYHQRPLAIAMQRRHYFELAVRERREVLWEETIEDGPLKGVLLRQLRPIFDADGKLRFLIGSGIDITASKQAEEQMARQQEFYESILNYLPVDIAVFDAEHRHLFINPSSISDPTVRQQILGMTNSEYFAFRQRPAIMGAMREQYFQQAVRLRKDISWEETLPGPNGPKRVLRTLRAVFAPDDTLRLVVGSGIDITARYAAEERQRQSENLLREQQNFIRLIVDTVPNVLYVMNQAGEVVFNNAAFDALAVRSSHRHPLQELETPVQDEIQQLVAWRQEVMETRKPLDVELPLIMKSGETCHLHVHIRPLDRTSSQREVLVVGTDITDLKLAQQAADANAQAKEAFLARMSHEIRTPLNGVLGMALLLQKTDLTPAQQEYLATMQRAGQHLLTLVNDVLDLAKITAHHLELDHAPFDVAVLLHSAGQTMAALATQKGIQLTIEPLPETRVLGDAYRLHQVLLNLLSNALKFTEEGTVSCGAAVVHTSPETIGLRFWVQDTGLGIAPEQQERIFESFAQASSDTSRHFGGTGLGLAISEQLVQQMGGMLRLCSRPGAGTIFSFTLTLPRATEAPPASQPPAPTSYEGLRGLRVLLAEDNAVNQWIARVLLEYWGVQVEAVGTGTDALAQLSAHDFDAALLDIRMPGLSGVEVTTAIRRHPNAQRAAVPIIALTANAFDADRQHYLDAGMNGCVTKPFEEADLCQLLLQLTRGAATAGYRAKEGG
ncbi:PAS domain-containing hybrid sensor histidine kinase/response regulator [Hymenobacter negativus]|uniref:histidine kinase n=1 Tax=Hymenobacter negativus TaxID=2795026 RepID=A0ABS3QF00_9BACT|nr:PAS domain-containing hybrid sensor histidine kinase/response regulator [Hymenobacter negativus]MBO2009824.1 PAS domain-containing protein [Hymenobacter negativus]